MKFFEIDALFARQVRFCLQSATFHFRSRADQFCPFVCPYRCLCFDNSVETSYGSIWTLGTFGIWIELKWGLINWNSSTWHKCMLELRETFLHAFEVINMCSSTRRKCVLRIIESKLTIGENLEKHIYFSLYSGNRLMGKIG